MKKKVFLAAGGVLGVVVLLAGTKACQIGKMIEAGAQFVPPPEAVAAADVKSEVWQARATAVGTVVAVQGVTVRAEVAGVVREIAFASGQAVAQGDVLVVPSPPGFPVTSPAAAARPLAGRHVDSPELARRWWTGEVGPTHTRAPDWQARAGIWPVNPGRG